MGEIGLFLSISIVSIRPLITYSELLRLEDGRTIPTSTSRGGWRVGSSYSQFIFTLPVGTPRLLDRS